jgi:transcription-repair coupling factor (superfamily II helicase)
MATFSADLIDLKPGDFVVHSEHGVAQYLGLREISQGENQGDYMLLEYSAGAKLYVPLTRMDLVQRFRGASTPSKRSNAIWRVRNPWIACSVVTWDTARLRW